MKKQFQTYTNIKARVTAVYHKPLKCWVFMKHTKDGRVHARVAPAYGFDTQFIKAVTKARAGGYALRPPASGWQRMTVKPPIQERWTCCHEHTWKLMNQ